jgi:hypothetical protein
VMRICIEKGVVASAARHGHPSITEMTVPLDTAI